MEFYHDKYGSDIMLPVSFGCDKNEYLLQFDNHSPSWINDGIISKAGSLKKSKNIFYKSSAADGRKIEGDVYVCDTVSIGSVKFNDVLFYAIDDTSRTTKGVIGENIISHGVWVIDFEYNKVIFTSSMDSLERRYFFELRMLPTTFRNNNFIIEPEFKNGVKVQFEIDLGFNGGAILPINDFNRIQHADSSNASIVRFSTPGGNEVIRNYTSRQRVLLGTDSVNIVYSSNEKVAESIVGQGFLREFAFVILDYPYKQLYISRYR